MIVIKRRKHPEQSPTPSQRIFADYPYPITTVLNKTYKHQKPSDRLCASASLQWCKDCFHKIVGKSHTRRSHNTSTSITEESSEQEHDNEDSTKAIVNTARTERVLTSLITPSMNDKINMTRSAHQMDDDQG